MAPSKTPKRSREGDQCSNLPSGKRQRREGEGSGPKTAVESPSPEAGEAEAAERGREKPLPIGRPPVWSQERQALMETLRYFRADQGSVYQADGIAYGILLSKDEGGRRFFGKDVVVTRTPGNFGALAGESGKRVGGYGQVRDAKRDDASVKSFFNNMKKLIPVVLLVEDKNEDCPVALPHKYNVLDHFFVTAIWPEKQHDKVCFKVRLERIDKAELPWWYPARPSAPLADERAGDEALGDVPQWTCRQCGQTALQILKGHKVCFNEKCAHFFMSAKQPSDGTGEATELPEDAEYDPAWLKQRADWPSQRRVPYSLIPVMPEPELDVFAYSRDMWKGVVCPQCHGCMGRIYWAGWYCPTTGCGWSMTTPMVVVSAKQLLKAHSLAFTGHAIDKNWTLHDLSTETSFHGHWHITAYDLEGGNKIVHLRSNKHINEGRAGSDDLLEELERVAGDIGLKRNEKAMAHMGRKGEHTQYWAVNFGFPYGHVAAAESRAFRDAPPAVMNSMNRMLWAAGIAAGTTGDAVQPLNEMLLVAYMQASHMGFHDDGEKTLGSTIATLSLGCDAHMDFRMKAKHYKGYTASNKPVIGEPVPPRALLATERRAILDSCSGQDATAKLKALFAKHKGEKAFAGTSPVVLRAHLKHGDMIVMQGADLQKYYEHQVVPDPQGKLRFALTARHVLPDMIDQQEHHKGDWDPAAYHQYDGTE